MACPSSRSKVTTHTHSSQEEKRDHRRRMSPPCTSTWRGEAATSNRFIITGSDPATSADHSVVLHHKQRDRGPRDSQSPLLDYREHCSATHEHLDASGCKGPSVNCHFILFRVVESETYHSGQQVRRRNTPGQDTHLQSTECACFHTSGGNRRTRREPTKNYAESTQKGPGLDRESLPAFLAIRQQC